MNTAVSRFEPEYDDLPDRQEEVRALKMAALLGEKLLAAGFGDKKFAIQPDRRGPDFSVLPEKILLQAGLTAPELRYLKEYAKGGGITEDIAFVFWERVYNIVNAVVDLKHPSTPKMLRDAADCIQTREIAGNITSRFEIRPFDTSSSDEEPSCWPHMSPADPN